MSVSKKKERKKSTDCNLRMNSMKVQGASRGPGGVVRVDPAISLDGPKYFTVFLKD